MCECKEGCGRLMTFQEAKAKLKEVSNGRYHSIGYELTEFAAGGFETECSVYIDPGRRGTGPTFEEAFARLGVPMDTHDPMSQAPEEVAV